MKELGSYLQGNWTTGVGGAGARATLVNPTTEEPLATTSTEGLDFKGAMDFARAGGRALRALTFAQRGELLRGLSRTLHGARDELMKLAIANGGNTRSDAKFDIDGASGTLSYYADLATELGDRHILDDGEPTALGRSARLAGHHVSVPRAGVALHINAFNFPAWGLGEKLACALLAGMPVVAKPATSTALVAHRIAELIVESRLLPAGAFSFVCGSSGDLLSHVDGQDVLAFTGGSATGVTLRRGDAVLRSSVRVNVEADSLNAAVLGPDAELGSDLVGLFLTDVVRDMTQKAGQKCTAIRRIYVAKQHLEAVVEELRARLAATRVGDPSLDDTQMGPLATEQQLRDCRAGIRRLETCAKLVLGGEAPLSPKGYFIAPTLLIGHDPRAGDAAHEHEVFGPVATIMPYDGTAEGAAALTRAGAGSLVSSVYSDDKEFLRAMVLGVASHHGRIVLSTSKLVGQTVPPGTVLPQLIHGGPGRAGSGEELGGRRGLAFYMQRVALQGDRAFLDGLSGRA